MSKAEEKADVKENKRYYKVSHALVKIPTVIVIAILPGITSNISAWASSLGPFLDTNLWRTSQKTIQDKE